MSSRIFLDLTPNMKRALMFYICLTFGSSVLGDNIALLKPAYQSSVITASYSSDPGNAVDGDRNSNINNGHCTGTRFEDQNPWWMVDLGKTFKIHNITIVVRTDNREDYLYDFYIEMFLVNPMTWNFPTPQLCLFYDGILNVEETLTCDVPVTGRYVRIRKISNLDKIPMYLCEVEIRGLEILEKQCEPNNVAIFEGKMLQTSFKQAVGSNSLSDCLSQCFFKVDCKGINYKRLTKSCEMILATSGDDTLLDDQEWRFVSMH